MILNDVIVRVAIERGLPLVDLREVIVDEADLANPLEPSSVGASKIARSIAAALGLTASTRPATAIFGDTG